MAFIYLDDSKHHKSGFSIAAFAICENDPTTELQSVFREFGYDPDSFEFKSSAPMNGDIRLQQLRSKLKDHIHSFCKVAICVVKNDKDIGPAALQLLRNGLDHPYLKDQRHEVFFDEGLFSSLNSACALVDRDEKLNDCNFHFEQDSKKVMGIQLADIVAHTCGIMLLDALGEINKTVEIHSPNDIIYDGLTVELGFEIWAGIRYAFLNQNKPNCDNDFDFVTVSVFPWGLFIDREVSNRVTTKAMEKFGEMYLGCIH